MTAGRGAALAAGLCAAGLAWPWPALDHAPPGAIRGAAASTIRIGQPAWYIPGLVAHWRFDDAENANGVDQANNYPLTASGTVARATGVHGYAQAVSGAGYRYSTNAWANALKGASKATLCGWYKVASTSARLAAGARSTATAGYGVYHGTDGYWYAIAADGNTSYGKVAASGQTSWHHLCNVYDGTATGNSGRLKLYIDGSEATLTYTGTIPATLADPGTPSVQFGRDGSFGAYSSASYDDVVLIVGTVPSAQTLDAIRAGLGLAQ